jgi:Tol biopolymer transport system component
MVTSLDGKLNQALSGLTNSALNPDGSLLVSRSTSTINQNGLVFTAPDGSNPRIYPLPGNILVDFAWSPTGEELAAVVAVRSDYSGKLTGDRNFLVNPKTLDVSEYPQTNLLNPRVLWSPDGASLFWIGTSFNVNGYMIGGDLFDRKLKKVTDLSKVINLTNPDYLVVTNANWLPLP